jgi:hypothetical protein
VDRPLGADIRFLVERVADSTCRVREGSIAVEMTCPTQAETDEDVTLTISADPGTPS